MPRSLPAAALLAFLALFVEPLLAQSAPSAQLESLQHKWHACLVEAEEELEAMLACADTAEAGWREQVERLTGRLGRALGEESREALALSEQAWQASREADLTLLEAYHAQLQEVELGRPGMLELSHRLQRNAIFEARANLLLRLLDGLGSLPAPELPPSSS
ncbi:lysozyme inhibitor LprI family protein [Halomonas sp. H10-9-1]|uniref:lysozyme inhibitor LprI family protein n=1 Tax=Halomonas sp. H10-9-1 TaxID=2950871 RepID=UPI0032DF22A1